MSSSDPDKLQSRIQCIKFLDLDIIGVAETHLLDDEELNISGYSWYGHCRKTRHFRCPGGSGGVGFMIKNEVKTDFDIRILDSTEDGILWIRLTNKSDQKTIQACVCYLPPEGSSSRVDAQDFYDNLLAQIYRYQNMGPYFICGDFNSRLGDMCDYVEGVDTLQQRSIVDVKKNKYGQYFQEFLLSTGTCIMNGRKMFGNNAYTSISGKGCSVIDYVCVPIEDMHLHDQMEILGAYDVFDEAECIGQFNINIPDHSILRWQMKLYVTESMCGDIKKSNSVKKIFERDNIPNDFMADADVCKKVRMCIERLEKANRTQQVLDTMNDDFCNIVYTEMETKLKSRTVGLSKSCRKQYKAWWSDELSELWKAVKKAERKMCRKREGNTQENRALFRDARKVFSRAVQRAKRRHWKAQQKQLMDTMHANPKVFWKEIGKIGIASERGKPLPATVIGKDGSELSGEDEVKDAWRDHFQDILNPSITLDAPANIQFAGNPHVHQQEFLDNSACINDDISHQEVYKALLLAKRGKACGSDDIPVEMLSSYMTRQYLTKLYNSCFKAGMVPQSWNYGVLQPIIKDKSIDTRYLSNYRGITLMDHICKLYSSIINSRLVAWVEENELVHDEQNGFRKKRSCQDQLKTFYSILQTRKAQGLETFTSFVDFRKAYDSISRTHLWYKLEKLGLHGSILNALKSLYHNVKCSVRTLNGLTSVFKVSRGLKQGCVISPMLFNLYINDLVTEINELRNGVSVNRKNISVLLYADDIVFLSSTAKGLQVLLDKLGDWCNRWGLHINTLKTKIIHVRARSVKQTTSLFKCNGLDLEVCSKYRYLGLWFTEHLDLQYMVKQVAASAQRSLGLLIAKSKCTGGMPYNCYSKLYDSLVQSVIDYGANVWGHSRYPCIEAVQHRAVRFFLGVHSKAPNTAIEGDMGWKSPFVRQWSAIAREWCRYSKMDDSRQNRHVFSWATNSRSTNWATKCHEMFNRYELDEAFDLANPCSKNIVKDLEYCMQNDFVNNVWKPDLNRIQAKTGQGLNKLRTYRLCKSEYGVESYVKNGAIARGDRRAMAQLRCSAAPIRIEVGRYDHGKYIPAEQRICQICMDGVENELHVLFKCSFYDDYHEYLTNKAIGLNPGYEAYDDVQKFTYIMADPNMVYYTAKTCKLILNRRRNFYYRM